jgi:hypothetical protein
MKTGNEVKPRPLATRTPQMPMQIKKNITPLQNYMLHHQTLTIYYVQVDKNMVVCILK